MKMKPRKIYKSIDEWKAEACRRFGNDHLKWRFVCPSCGNVQTIQQFKDLVKEYPTLTPETAFFSCIGRYTGHDKTPMCSKKSPCNYTNGGLFNIAPAEVLDPDGKPHYVFDFDEGDHGNN